MEKIFLKRPLGITVQIKDPVEKKSKSFTVHGISLEKLFFNLKFYIEVISKHGEDIKIVCYRKGEKNEKAVNGTGKGNI